MAQSAKHKDPRKGDDRNLVIVDQDFGQPDLEDRMFLFWTRNKTTILSVSALTVAAAIAAIVWFWLADFRLGLLQDAYQGVADKPEARLAFARENDGKPLAGVAALEAADAFFKDGKFKEAADGYAFAAKNFDPTDSFGAAYAGRAQLFGAFARLRLNDADGRAALADVAGNRALPNAFRGRALHTLGVLAIARGDLAEARKALDETDRIDPRGAWAFAKRELLLLAPELSKPPAPAVAPETVKTAPVPAKPETPSTAPAAPANPEAPKPAPAPTASATPAPPAAGSPKP